MRFCLLAWVFGTEVRELHAQECGSACSQPVVANPTRNALYEKRRAISAGEPNGVPWRTQVDGGPLQLRPLGGFVPAATQSPKLVLGLRLPTFIAFGVGGLSASAAVATHLFAGMSAQYGDPNRGCIGHCGSSSSTLATTSTICASIAAAAVGTGVALMLFEPKREAPTFAPALKVSLSGSKAAATAAWSF